VRLRTDSQVQKTSFPGQRMHWATTVLEYSGWVPTEGLIFTGLSLMEFVLRIKCSGLASNRGHKSLQYFHDA